MPREKEVNRRRVLRNISVASAVSVAGLTGTSSAAPNDKSKKVNVNKLLKTESVRALHGAVPGLRIRRSTASVVRSDLPVLSVEANYGTMVLSGTGSNQTLQFYFNEHVPQVDAPWPEETTGHMKVTSDGVTFQRTPTKREREAYLEAMDKPELVAEDSVWLSLTPDTGEITVTHVDTSDRTVTFTHSQIVGQSAGSVATADAANVDIVVTSEETRGSNAPSTDDSTGLVTQSSHDDGVCEGCDDDVAADVLVCLSQVTTCAPCLAFASTGPVIVACIFIVCLGINSATGVAAFLEDVTIPGCTNLAGCIGACIGDWFDQYFQII